MLLETYSAFTERCLLFLVQKQNSAPVLAAACGKKLRSWVFSAHKYKLILEVGCQTAPLSFFMHLCEAWAQYIFFFSTCTPCTSRGQEGIVYN